MAHGPGCPDVDVWRRYALTLLGLPEHGETRRRVEGCTNFEIRERAEIGTEESTH